MTRLLALSSLLICLCAAPTSAQEVRTQAPCSPVIDRTQGNVTVNFTGGCTAGITPAQIQEIVERVLAGRPIPAEFLDKYESISRQFGVADTALTTFFRILGNSKVAIEDLDAKLREIAARHLTLLKQVESLPGDDPQVETLKKEAVAAIGAGDYPRAQGLLEQAFDADLVAARKALDAANRRYVTAAKTKADLGQLKWTQLQYAAAAQEFQAAADLVPSSEPLIRAEYLASLGSAAHSAGNYPLAGRALVEALAFREQALGPDHANVAISLNNLAVVYRAQGRYAEAEPLHKRALAISEKVLGPEHPTVAIRLNNLAGLYQDQRRYVEAEPLYKRALAIGENVLGPEHPDVAIRLNNLALLYGVQGRYAEAEPLFTRALAIGEKALGPEHPNVAAGLNNLAVLYKRQGRYAEAEPLFTRALALGEKILGPEHPDVAIRLNNLAVLYQDQRRYAEAEPLYKRALAIDEKVLGLDHPHTKNIRKHLESLRQSAAPPTEMLPGKPSQPRESAKQRVPQ
jgi:tetratricopeptide (TPR) repeat protein